MIRDFWRFKSLFFNISRCFWIVLQNSARRNLPVFPERQIEPFNNFAYKGTFLVTVSWLDLYALSLCKLHRFSESMCLRPLFCNQPNPSSSKACNFTKSNILHGCFSHFLNCANGTKSRKASQLLFRGSVKEWTMAPFKFNPLVPDVH